MTARPARIVDAHVHLWDPARTDWYPYLSTGQAALGMGDVSGMCRHFDVGTYLDEAARWNVEKLVNVAAATGWYSIQETLELDRRADHDGHPDALIGGLPPTDSVAEAVAVLDQQLAARRFRGVRPMGTLEGPLPADGVLRALSERHLVFELMSHPDQLVPAAKRLERHRDLIVVIEHTGWPRNNSTSEWALWAEGIDALAGLGENVVCKLSGLAMSLGSMAVDVQAPWIEYAINAFGFNRCLFASNFPVDGVHGSLAQLFATYDAITAGVDSDDRNKLFAANAERIYGL